MTSDRGGGLGRGIISPLFMYFLFLSYSTWDGFSRANN
jgi:hypothetical protein